MMDGISIQLDKQARKIAQHPRPYPPSHAVTYCYSRFKSIFIIKDTLQMRPHKTPGLNLSIGG